MKAKNIFQKVESDIVDTEDGNLKNINITVEEKATGEILVGAGVGSEVVLHNFQFQKIIFSEKV